MRVPSGVSHSTAPSQRCGARRCPQSSPCILLMNSYMLFLEAKEKFFFYLFYKWGN